MKYIKLSIKYNHLISINKINIVIIKILMLINYYLNIKINNI